MREIVNAPHLAEDDYPRIEQSLGSDASCGNQVPLAAGAALVATSTPEQSVTLDMPGKLAELLRATELDDAERAALDQGADRTTRAGYALRIAAAPAVRCQPLGVPQGAPTVPDAAHKARRGYENRVNTLVAAVQR